MRRSFKLSNKPIKQILVKGCEFGANVKEQCNRFKIAGFDSKDRLLNYVLGSILASLIFISSAHADRLCVGEPNGCGMADFCTWKHARMTPIQFVAWENENQHVFYEELHRTADYVQFKYIESCEEKFTCWDAMGSCLK